MAVILMLLLLLFVAYTAQNGEIEFVDGEKKKLFSRKCLYSYKIYC